MGKWAKYTKKHNKDWKREPTFKGWLTSKQQSVCASSSSSNNIGDGDVSYCKICSVELRSHKGDLLKHASTSTTQQMEIKKKELILATYIASLSAIFGIDHLSEESDVDHHKGFNDVILLIWSLAGQILKPPLVQELKIQNDIDVLNNSLKFENNFLKFENCDFGYYFNIELENADLPAEEVQALKQKCLDFIKILIQELIKHNDITLEILNTLTKNDLKELIPNSLGIRRQISLKISELKKKEGETSSCGTTAVTYESDSSVITLTDCDSFFESNTFVDFDLKTLLSTSPLGNSILKYYETNGQLDNTRRNRLVDIMIKHLYNHILRRRLNHSDYNKLSAKIISLFSKESIGVYYVPAIRKADSPTGKSILARGKLVDKCRNLIHKCEEATPIRKKRKHSEEENQPTPEVTSVSEDIADDILWLQIHSEPFEDVLLKWQNTVKYRLDKNKDLKYVSEYLDTWPCIKRSKYEILIESDFKYLYSSKELMLYSRWNKFIDGVIRLRNNSSNNKHVQELLLMRNATECRNAKFLYDLILFPHLIPPKGRIIEGKSHWKFSLLETTEAVLVHAQIISRMEEDTLSNSESCSFIADVSDSEDPTYTPEKERKEEKKRSIPVFFNIRNIKYKTCSDVTSASSSKGSECSDICDIRQNIPDESLQLAVLQKCPYLDGKFFKVTKLNELKKNVEAQCQLCLPKTVTIKGTWGVSTNYLKHLKKIHDKENAMKEYDDYKSTKKQKKENIPENKRNVKNAIQSDPTLRTRHTNSISKCTILWKMAGKPKTSEIILEVLGHNLSYPGATRWNSMFDAINQILKEKDKLCTLFEKLDIKKQMFKESEIEYLTQYCIILKPLASALDILQGEKNAFFGFLLPCLGSLLKKFERMQFENFKVSKPILDACHDALLEGFRSTLTFQQKKLKMQQLQRLLCHNLN
ncbi:unnamed protein product [Brassicogethes aeneus]|uniref:Uncharacterized protein n=1 Tax=Brassicogethes aeneus TaxID=1431903 RepID=A0A9P0BGW9_BRAAE|nr:unnamed protein product [Brassicogethes aeneus]